MPRESKQLESSDEFALCAVCHRDVPPTHIVRLSGRLQCLACAAAWFEDEDEQDGKPDGKETEH